MNDSNDGAVRARRGLTTLGQSIGRVTSPALRRRGFAQAAIITAWDTIVGHPLSEHTQPSRIVFPRGERTGGTLHLLVSSAFAPDVQHLAPQIIERINGHFGYGAIARLELHHGRLNPPEHGAAAPAATAPEPSPALRKAIGRIADERLGAALDRLARARAAAALGAADSKIGGSAAALGAADLRKGAAARAHGVKPRNRPPARGPRGDS